ncbi:hypothetical protein DM01DRAFT_1119041 [Hesseltinella vesiculosa]|uniref:BRCA2 OB1 domain-containing protein n=1 Tax=Hesseltinella vesiculosa TaxID=101127 RepID=A0A1X2GTD0_9FUNG|nr:hypothetical protein DM01DRAFT_1119041 [Hesseltinella vesiculosa]
MYTFSPKWTSDDAYEALLEAGALPSLLTKTWVSNHYGWIVWKLALRIRQFPWEHVPDGKFQWSPTHVINQLLYRYEREINMGQRSVIKRIMEHDDTPTKPMVLMVADIVAEVRNDGSKAYRLQLTDGWYQISAALDNRLEMMLDLQRLYIGQKIMIVGAQLQHGSTATSPLSSLVTTDEKHDRTSTALLLSANSCLPCAWDWKLGYQRQRRRQVRRIDDNVYEDGGVVTMLEIIICKKYPMMYSETLASGASQIRSSKEEEFVRLSLDQLQNKSPLERNVSGYFRLRICDISTRKKTLATLLISQATEFTHSALIEGNAYRLFFVQPYQPKFKNHIGLHLRTTRLTSWEQIVPPSTTTYPLRSISLCIDMKSVSDTDTDMVVYVLDAHDPLQTKRNCNISLWRQKLLVTDRSMAICQVVVNSFSRPAYIVPGQIICLLNVRCALHDSKYDITHIKTSDETEVIAKSTDCRHRDMVPELKHWAETAKEDMNRVKSRLGAIQSKPRIL